MKFIEGVLVPAVIGSLLSGVSCRPSGLRLGANRPPPRTPNSHWPHAPPALPSRIAAIEMATIARLFQHPAMGLF